MPWPLLGGGDGKAPTAMQNIQLPFELYCSGACLATRHILLPFLSSLRPLGQTRCLEVCTCAPLQPLTHLKGIVAREVKSHLAHHVPCSCGHRLQVDPGAFFGQHWL